MLDFAFVSLVVDVQRHASQRFGNGLDSFDPKRSDHAKASVCFLMPEFEREIPGLDVDSGRDDENGLEANALGADITVGSRLSALPNVAKSFQVPLAEAIFVAINNYTIRMYLEGDERGCIALLGFLEDIVLGILKKLKDEASTTPVYLFGQSAKGLASVIECLVHSPHFDGLRCPVFHTHELFINSKAVFGLEVLLDVVHHFFDQVPIFHRQSSYNLLCFLYSRHDDRVGGPCLSRCRFSNDGWLVDKNHKPLRGQEKCKRGRV